MQQSKRTSQQCFQLNCSRVSWHAYVTIFSNIKDWQIKPKNKRRSGDPVLRETWFEPCTYKPLQNTRPSYHIWLCKQLFLRLTDRSSEKYSLMLNIKFQHSYGDCVPNEIQTALILSSSHHYVLISTVFTSGHSFKLSYQTQSSLKS